VDYDLAFTIANASVLPAWLLLFIVPHHRVTHLVVHSVLMPGLLGVAYVSFIGVGMATGGEGDFSSLHGVMALFDHEPAVVGAWIHYLVFDLFVGAWIVRDGKRRGVHRAWVSVCLFFTFMLGPSGLLGYLAGRAFAGGDRVTLDEATAGAVDR